MTAASSLTISYSDKIKFYRELASEVSGLLEKHWLINLANTSALLKQHLPDVNWAGFYLSNRNQVLLLGPFQGLPACNRIPLGKGVCGTAAKTRKSILVPDVSQFPDHIVCDTASRSELVVPMIKNEQLIGVLDVDSPSLNRFDLEDQAGLEKIVGLLVDKTDWNYWNSGFHF